MIELIRGAFRGLFSIIVVLLIIGVIIVGATYLNNNPLIGLLIIGIGLILVISLTGTMAVFLNIDGNLEKHNKYFELILKKQNIVFSDETDETIYSSSNEKRCNVCEQILPIKIKKCPDCGSTDFSQV